MASNRIPIDEIKRCTGIVVSALRMKLDSVVPLERKQKVLLVEGETDKAFLSGKLEDDVKSFPMGTILKNRNAFLKDNSKHADSSKEVIMHTVYGLNVLPAIISVKGAERWLVSGIIDRDYEDFDLFTGSKGLYVTDTHDLETLIMSFDPHVWGRLNNCLIKDEDVQKACFVAYQMALFRNAIREKGRISVRVAKSGSFELPFKDFITNHMVSLPKFLEYINEKNKEEEPKDVISVKECEKLIHDIVTDKKMKKQITAEGFMKTSLGIFDIASIENYWSIVDGHDILALIRFYNSSASERYGGKQNGLNRRFEMDIIKCCDHEKFKRTELFSQLHKNELVKEY